MLRKQRYLIPLFVTGFWLVMMGLFAHRQGWFDAAPPAPAVPPAFQAQDQWMGIFLDNDRRVGHLHMKSEAASKDGAPGYSLALDARLETSLFGVDARLDIEGGAWSAENGDRSEFHFTLASGEYTMGVEGTVADKRLRATMRTGGEDIPLDFPMDNPIFPGGGLGVPGAGMPLLEPGESTFVDALDPMLMQMKPAKIACLARETLQIDGRPYETSVYTTTIGSITSKAWIGPNQEVVQATTPFGFTLRIIDPASLGEKVEAGGQGDLIQSLAVLATGKTVFVDATHMSVRVSGVDTKRIPDGPPWQRREGDTLDIRQPEPLPDPGVDPAPSPPDFDTAPYLKGDPFVASDSPKIASQARTIVGEETNPWRQSVLLYQWTYDNIEKIPVLSVPNALDTLRTRQGDCNEHTVLYAALARSLGIPCRIAIGLVYSDTLGGFGYHAWPEVYYGGWYPVDPTLGQLAPDATHIKLLTGNMEAWVQLAAYIGQLKLEILSVE